MSPRSLKGKLFVAVVLLGIFPFSLSIALGAYWAHRKLLAHAQERLATFPLPVLRRMEALLYARWNDVHLLAHMPLFRNPEGAEYQAALLRRAVELYEPYALVALADERGRVVASSDPRLMNTDTSGTRWFREARRITLSDWRNAARSIYISEPYIPTAGDGRPVMCFNSPVYDFEGRFSGVVHSEVKLSALAPFLASLRLDRTGRALLVREDGKVLLDDRGTLRSLHVSVAGHPAFERARAGEAIVVRDRDIEGDAALVSSFQLRGFDRYPGVKWFLLVSQKESEIYGPAREMLVFHSLAVFLGVSLIFLGGFILFDRNISKPLAQLMQGVRALAARGPTADAEVAVRSRDEIGELARAFSAMVRNLAAQEQARRDLQDQLVQKERLAAIGEMVAGVAHQIKNPLATIKVVSQTLGEELPLDAPAQAALARIDKEVNRLNQFLQTFFNFAAPREPRERPCDVRRLVEEALSQVEEERARAGVRVTARYAPCLPALRVDPEQMLHVFLNLFLNALQAMPEGGELTVEVEAGTLAGGNPAQPVPRVTIRVSDTGCGIAPELVSKVFRPFFTTRPSGTGLGLSLVYKVVQMHGGEVHARSRPGRGSTFEVVLPVPGGNESGNDQAGVERSV